MKNTTNEIIEETGRKLRSAKKLNADNPNTNPGNGKNFLERDIWNLTQKMTELTGIKFK